MKKSITSKIIISYLVLVFSSLAFAGMLFTVVTERYAENKAKSLLARDAKSLGEAFKNKDIQETRNIQILRERLKKIRSLDCEAAVITRPKLEYKLIYPQKTSESAMVFENEILPLMIDKLGSSIQKDIKFVLDGTEYLSVVYPFGISDLGGTKGWIVLYTKVGQVRELRQSMLRILLVSLACTGILALVFGIFFARSIAKPIIALRKRAELLSRRDFDSKVEIHTGDELEELAHTINKMAFELKEYDMAQKKFLQNASHELKTPLMSIQGYAEGIKDGVFENNEQALGIIVEESTRLKKLVEELIYLSKLETMEDFYNFSMESMNEAIEKSVEKVRSLAVKNDIKINLMLYKDAVLNIDKDKFIQALINILGNCLRYAHSEINISTINDGKRFEIKINDDGDGFDEKELKNVFERFYKGKKGNTGLGLSITKVIVEKHNGSIIAANGQNGGAEFRLVFVVNQG